jgi:hypothetical protein
VQQLVANGVDAALILAPRRSADAARERRNSEQGGARIEHRGAPSQGYESFICLE